MASSRGTGQPTREDRLARQQRDPGDPEDDVYTARNSPYYHDDRDCKRLKQVADDDVSSDTRAAEQRRWKAPCLWCVLDE